MNQQTTVWVVSEYVHDHYGDYTTIIGVYTDESIAQQVYSRSAAYSIEQVYLNATNI